MSKTKEKSLYKKLILPILLAFIAGGWGILGVTNYGLGKGLSNHYKNELKKQTEALIASANEQKKQLESSMNFFSASGDIAQFFLQNTASASDFVKTTAHSFKFTNVSLLSFDGSTIASTNALGFKAESVMNFQAVKKALSGQSSASTVYFDNHITHIAAIPIKDGSVVLGVLIITDYLTDNFFVDTYKKLLGSEITVFHENRRLDTTIRGEDKMRLIGTLMENPVILETVYNKKHVFIGDNTINGYPYAVSYAPYTLDEGGRAMLFLGMPMQSIKEIETNLLFIILPFVILVCALLFVVFLFLVRLIIMKPLLLASRAIKNLSMDTGESDLTYTIDIDLDDEVGRLCKDINTFINKQRVIVTQLKSAQESLKTIGDNLGVTSHQTAGAISEITANIEGVRKQTEHQDQSITKTSGLVQDTIAGIEQLDGLIETQSAGIIESSASIEEMVGNIKSVTKSMEKMSTQFKELISVTSDGKNRQLDVDARVKEMAQQSELLMEANSVISRIASQTNLLAMNAAIEAAHAGKAGAGFSVVADEIRKLAEESSTQSKTIKKELKDISGSITNVVNSSQLSQEAFTLIMEKIADTDNLVQEIGAAMVEQNEASGQVLEALKDINNSTSQVQTTAKTMKEETSQVNLEMKNLAQIGMTVSGSMDEMAYGVKDINDSAQTLSDMAQKTHENIRIVEDLVNKFII